MTVTRATSCLFGTRAPMFSSSSSFSPASSTSSSSSSSPSSSPPTPPKLAHTDLSSPEGDEPGQVRIDAYDATSFELSIAGKVPGSTRRRRISGPLVLSAPGGFVARWKAAAADASSSSSSSSLSSSSGVAAIAALVSPRPDIVLVGTGRDAGSGSGGGSGGSRRGGGGATSPSTAAASEEISRAAGGAAVELHPTARAAALYNVLSQEGRSVLAAMLPAGEDGSCLFSASK